MRDNFGNSQPIYDMSTVRLAEMTSDMRTHADGRPWGMPTCRRARRGQARRSQCCRGTKGWSRGGPISFTHAVNKTNVNRGTTELRLHIHFQKGRKKRTWQALAGGGSVETGTLTDAGGNVKWYSCCWKQMSLKKLNTELIRSSNSTCGYTSKRTESMYSNRYLYTEDHSSIS